jgi:hypothetical protein
VPVTPPRREDARAVLNTEAKAHRELAMAVGDPSLVQRVRNLADAAVRALGIDDPSLVEWTRRAAAAALARIGAK